MRSPILMLLACGLLPATAQDIQFDQGDWNTTQVTQQQRGPVLISNQVLSDTLFVEDIDSGALTMVVDPPTLTRIEYDAATQGQVRRIDIRQESLIDSVYVEEISTGSLVLVTEPKFKDIPNGDYLEYHSNGSIRVMGTLEGFDAQGKPKKVGEWTEWDMDGNIIRRQTFPVN